VKIQWDLKMLALSGGLLVVLILVMVWVALELRREKPGMILSDGSVNLPPITHPDVEAGLEALRIGENEKARELFSRVPATDASYTVALQNLGLANEKLGNFEAATEVYRGIIALQPDNPEPYMSLAWAQYQMGRFDEAEFSALRVLEISSGHIPARYGVALFRVAGDRIAEAIQSYMRAIKLDPAGAYFPQAEDHLELLRADQPELASVHYALAYFANARGDRRQELEHLERFLALEPSGPAAATARERLTEARTAVGALPEPAGEGGR
jgi:tetratricopeptide (TPR) repeat protein